MEIIICCNAIICQHLVDQSLESVVSPSPQNPRLPRALRLTPGRANALKIETPAIAEPALLCTDLMARSLPPTHPSLQQHAETVVLPSKSSMDYHRQM